MTEKEKRAYEWALKCNYTSVAADYANTLALYIKSSMDRAEAAEAALERHKKWVNDLQSGMYVNCVYCGHRYGPEKDTPVSMAEVLKAHIEKCPEHPMSKLKTVLAAERAEKEKWQGIAERLYEAFWHFSYESEKNEAIGAYEVARQDDVAEKRIEVCKRVRQGTYEAAKEELK